MCERSPLLYGVWHRKNGVLIAVTERGFEIEAVSSVVNPL